MTETAVVTVEPWIIRGLPSSDYHAIPALSASMALAIVEECPLKAWAASAFNPAAEAKTARHFDIGTALHLAVLEPREREKRVAVVRGYTKKGDYSPGYASEDAKAQREAAYAAGITPLLPEEADMVDELRGSLLTTPEISSLLSVPGDAEISLHWSWNGLACKARPDFLPADWGFILDLKSAASAAPGAISRKAFAEGWHVRAAWYLAAVEAVTGTRPAHYWYAVGEKDKPHIWQLYEMDERALIRGEQIIMRALDVAETCMRTGEWPKYRPGPSVISLPTYAEFRYAEQEEAGEL